MNSEDLSTDHIFKANWFCRHKLENRFYVMISANYVVRKVILSVTDKRVYNLNSVSIFIEPSLRPAICLSELCQTCQCDSTYYLTIATRIRA